MKKKLLLFLLLGSMGMLAVFSAEARDAALRSLALCASVIVPSLFPFFVCTDLITALSGWSAPWLLGLLGGYPTGARVTAALYENGSLSREDAEQVLLSGSFCGPGFVFGVLGGTVFRSVKTALLLWLVHIGSGILIGFLFRKKKPVSVPHVKSSAPAVKDPVRAFTDAVTNAGQSVLRVCAFVTAFGVFTGLLQKLLPLPAIAVGILEMSSGCVLLANAALPFAFKCAAASFLIGFGGLCVLAQCRSFAGSLCSRRYLFAKLLHGLVAAVISYLLFSLLPTDAVLPAGNFVQSFPYLPLLLLHFALCGTICLLFLKITGGNSERNRV